MRLCTRRSGEACRKKKTTLTPPHSPCVLANALCARQTIPPATQVTSQKVRKLKGSQSFYQNSPSEDKEYCLNDISAIKSRLHHISLFNNSIINFFHKTEQDLLFLPFGSVLNRHRHSHSLLATSENRRERSRNLSRNGNWDRYWGRACQLYATSTFPIMHLICPPKFCISIVFHFSWDGCYTQAKWKT